MELKQHEPRNYCFESTEHLNIRKADFIGASSLEHKLQVYLVNSLSICQDLA